jgi:hypothetical protein
MHGARGSSQASTSVRVVAALLLTGLISLVCATPARAATYPCSYGTPGRTPLSDSPPEGRPYLPGAESLDPAIRKYFALTTTNADGDRGFCECIQPRPWGHGLEAGAVESVKAAMDAKEAEAFANYAAFGVAPEAVPVEARTIWLRVTWRSREEQECLWTRLGPGWAARPGSSPHESGVAIDIEDWGPQWFGQDARLLEAHGWCRTVASEPWHYEHRPTLEARGLGSRCK